MDYPIYGLSNLWIIQFMDYPIYGLQQLYPISKTFSNYNIDENFQPWWYSFSSAKLAHCLVMYEAIFITINEMIQYNILWKSNDEILLLT